MEAEGHTPRPSPHFGNNSNPQSRGFLFNSLLSRPELEKEVHLFSMMDLALEDQDWEEVAYIRSRNIISEETQGFLVQSRTKEHAERERGSLFYVNREVKQGQVNNLNSLKINNVETQVKVKIETEVLGYFSALFNAS